jgi:hypothetical protein
MGTMSASDAAPLPRLGEVFFDVRGNSRSMRLSWYADTGVAVLSIWQGGMCTGTFRLAIADLPRMVETLQRGPDGQQPGWEGEAPGQAFAGAPADATAQVRSMGPMSGQMVQPAAAEFGGGTPDYLAEPSGPRTGAVDYPAASAGRHGGSGQYPAEPPRQRPQPAPGLDGYPGEQQPPSRRGAAPDYLADPLEALGQLGVPEAPPAAAPAPYQTGAPDYLAAPPPDRRPSAVEYPAEPRPDQRPNPAEYLTGPAPDQRPGPADYPAGPPDQRPGPADYPAGPSGYPAATPAPAGPGPDYLADLPAPPNADRAGYGADFHAGSGPGGSYPGAGDSGAYPRGTGHQGTYQGEPASDPYLVGTGPMDYQDEPPVSQYPGGSAAPRSGRRSAPRSAPRSGPGPAPQGDPLGPSTADYPVHYGAALTDDMADEPPLESFPYQPRRGGR